MKKKLISILDYRELFVNLRYLRKLRFSRKEKIPFKIKRRYGRKALEKFVLDFWNGGYVYLETGDYLYLPPMEEMNVFWKLKEPYIPEQIIEKFSSPGNTVMDIGANIGEWTLRMANTVGPKGRVFSFEPIPIINQSLKKTLHINNLSQVILSQVALDNCSGNSKFTIPLDKDDRAIHGESRLGKEEGNWNIFTEVGKTKTIEVKTITLDQFASEKPIERLDFVKIDVEGKELHVLEGGKETFSRFTPALILEVGCEEESERKRIADLLRTWGYGITGVVVAHGVIEVSWEQYITLGNPFIKKYPSNVLFLGNLS
jgi:FkbM family methyltransferase